MKGLSRVGLSGDEAMRLKMAGCELVDELESAKPIAWMMDFTLSMRHRFQREARAMSIPKRTQVSSADHEEEPEDDKCQNTGHCPEETELEGLNGLSKGHNY